MAFPVYNVSFRRGQKNDVIAVGEIVNESSKGYAWQCSRSCFLTGIT